MKQNPGIIGLLRFLGWYLTSARGVCERSAKQVILAAWGGKTFAPGCNAALEIWHNTRMITPNDSLPAGQSAGNTKPEWLRIPEAKRIFGIGRSTLYVLIGSGKVKSCSLRRRGTMRGIRLISYDSLAAFIRNQPTGFSDSPDSDV